MIKTIGSRIYDCNSRDDERGHLVGLTAVDGDNRLIEIKRSKNRYYTYIFPKDTDVRIISADHSIFPSPDGGSKKHRK